MPSAITPPPIQSHRIIGFTRTPSVTRPPSFGDDTSVRYTSSMGPVCTDGVPMPSVLFGNVETAGA